MASVAEKVVELWRSRNIHNIAAQQLEAAWTNYGNGDKDWRGRVKEIWMEPMTELLTGASSIDGQSIQDSLMQLRSISKTSLPSILKVKETMLCSCFPHTVSPWMWSTEVGSFDMVYVIVMLTLCRGSISSRSCSNCQCCNAKTEAFACIPFGLAVPSWT